MKKYVKCIDNSRGQYNLTIGKIYELTKSSDMFYWVVNDCNHDLNYRTTFFKSVGCPCDIGSCVKHRIKQ